MAWKTSKQIFTGEQLSRLSYSQVSWLLKNARPEFISALNAVSKSANQQIRRLEKSGNAGTSTAYKARQQSQGKFGDEKVGRFREKQKKGATDKELLSAWRELRTWNRSKTKTTKGTKEYEKRQRQGGKTTGLSPEDLKRYWGYCREHYGWSSDEADLVAAEYYSENGTPINSSIWTNFETMQNLANTAYERSAYDDDDDWLPF